MESMYQRGKIQEESMYYEHLKHSGELPLVGVNTFLPDSQQDDAEVVQTQLIRSSDEEKRAQVDNVRAFQQRYADRSQAALAALASAAESGENTFATLVEAVKTCSLGTITHALYQVGGQYRRNM
jgi:methylmalonyl-CoA mutase